MTTEFDRIKDQLKEIKLQMVNKRDLNILSMHIDKQLNKMYKKIIDRETSVKNQLIKILNASKNIPKDDLSEVMAQIDMLGKDEN